MSNSTVVSLCNFPIGPEFKPGLFPNDYVIPAATEDTLGLLVVSDGFTDIPQLDHKSIRMTISSEEIAKAIVDDWKSAQLQVGPGAAPGLFFVEGKQDEETIRKKHAPAIAKAKAEHTVWAQRLLKMADDLWQLKPVHRQIASTMINAAKYLKEDRVWMKSARPEDTIRCPGCTAIVPAAAAVCQHCSAILDDKKYQQLTFASR